jgi:hypothetical protein
MADGTRNQEYKRPPGFRFVLGGVDVSDEPDALQFPKQASAKNVRSTLGGAGIQTRPGYELLFGGLGPVTDIRAYTTLGTDDLPRLLARDSGGQVGLDTGAVITTLSGSSIGGASMIPFRPGASPESWMYVAGLGDYQKISSPGLGPVTAKVGIAEPQAACEAIPWTTCWNYFLGAAGDWAATGTAGGVGGGGNLVNDTAVAVFPLNGDRIAIRVAFTQGFFEGEFLSFGGGTNFATVQDVLPAIGTNLTVQSVFYYSGTTGKCVIVPSQLPIGEVPGTLGLVRRGAIVTIGGESVVVTGSTLGPDGSVAFYCTTVGTVAVGATIVGHPSIVVEVSPAVVGGTIQVPALSSTVTTGVGMVSQTLATSPFANLLTGGSNPPYPQADDYVHLVISVSDAKLVTELDIIFNTGAAPPDFVSQTYTFTTTALKTGLQEIHFPISSLVPNSSTATLADLMSCNGIQLKITVKDAVAMVWGSLWLGGGGQPDIGDAGAPYVYRAVPRSSLTGAKGNASPTMRYQVNVRRQNVRVFPPSATYDSQIDTWDIFRAGGSVPGTPDNPGGYRYLGSVPATAGVSFLDSYFDDAALDGLALETNNFEPWPSIDIPFTVGNADIRGTVILVNLSPPATITRWLPGTLVTVTALGDSARGRSSRTFTLWNRPTLVTGSTWLFQLEESANAATGLTFQVQEPDVARQPVPWMFGPNAQGNIFAVGDALRPGVVYFCKANQPDSAPDANVLDLTPPSEPLIGGECVDGVALVASTERWWALYPSFNSPGQPYTQIERPVGRGMIAPYGHCTDGMRIFFWTKDGIWTTVGGPGQSLTDADLYPLFPHEGVQGQDIVRNGVTYYAPDYNRAAEFRLEYANGYIYADYPGSNGPATLVCDVRSGAWVTDIYANPMTVHYALEQQSGSLTSGAGITYDTVVMGDSAGNVYREVDCVNDAGMPINCIVATPEWNGGDERAGKQWGDLYVDCVPRNGLTITPTSMGTATSSPTVVLSSNARNFVPVSVGGGELETFLGLVLEWTEP